MPLRHRGILLTGAIALGIPSYLAFGGSQHLQIGVTGFIQSLSDSRDGTPGAGSGVETTEEHANIYGTVGYLARLGSAEIRVSPSHHTCQVGNEVSFALPMFARLDLVEEATQKLLQLRDGCGQSQRLTITY